MCILFWVGQWLLTRPFVEVTNTNFELKNKIVEKFLSFNVFLYFSQVRVSVSLIETLAYIIFLFRNWLLCAFICLWIITNAYMIGSGFLRKYLWSTTTLKGLLWRSISHTHCFDSYWGKMAHYKCLDIMHYLTFKF